MTSPDGIVDAVLTKEEYGATLSDQYYLYIVRKGEQPEKNRHVARFTNPVELRLQWTEVAVLDVLLMKANVYDFRNNVAVRLGRMKVDSIEIRLCPQEQYSVPNTGNPPRGVWP